MKTDFSLRLKNARIESGLKAQYVAETVGVTLRAIYNYENGIREPSLDTLAKLCDVLGVTSDYLIGRTDY